MVFFDRNFAQVGDAVALLVAQLLRGSILIRTRLDSTGDRFNLVLLKGLTELLITNYEFLLLARNYCRGTIINFTI